MRERKCLPLVQVTVLSVTKISGKKKDQLKNERASGNSQHGGGGMDTGT